MTPRSGKWNTRTCYQHLRGLNNKRSFPKNFEMLGSIVNKREEIGEIKLGLQ